jgi:hypothetical protein
MDRVECAYQGHGQGQIPHGHSSEQPGEAQCDGQQQRLLKGQAAVVSLGKPSSTGSIKDRSTGSEGSCCGSCAHLMHISSRHVMAMLVLHVLLLHML